MNLVRILNAEPLNYSPKARKILQSVGEVHEKTLTRDELIRCVNDFHVLIVRLCFQVDQEVIRAGSNLKAIVTATTGLDHIDLEAAAEQGVSVLSLQGQFEFLTSIYATAEHTWALLLALIRKIPSAMTSVMQEQWDRDLFRGNELHGKVLGVVGYGRLGQKIVRYGQAFGMQVIVYDPYKKVDVSSQVKQADTLDELLTASDVVSLHVPLNEETHHLISNPELKLMKPGSLLVNTSRGAVIDEQALLRALRSRHLGGAGLDVLCNEANLFRQGKHHLIEYAKANNNLLITPHIAGATHESMEKTEIFMARKLSRFYQNIK